MSFNQSAQLSVQSSLRASDRLPALSAGGIGAELMQFDVRTIDKSYAAEVTRIFQHSPSGIYENGISGYPDGSRSRKVLVALR